MGLVDFEFACGFCAVDRGGLRGGFLVDFGGGLRCGGSGGLRGGSRWVCEVALGGGGGFWLIPVVMGACDYCLFIANKNNNNNN
jgi:hypothetical protein